MYLDFNQLNEIEFTVNVLKDIAQNKELNSIIASATIELSVQQMAKLVDLHDNATENFNPLDTANVDLTFEYLVKIKQLKRDIIDIQIKTYRRSYGLKK